MTLQEAIRSGKRHRRESVSSVWHEAISWKAYSQRRGEHGAWEADQQPEMTYHADDVLADDWRIEEEITRNELDSAFQHLWSHVLYLQGRITKLENPQTESKKTPAEQAWDACPNKVQHPDMCGCGRK